MYLSLGYEVLLENEFVDREYSLNVNIVNK